MRYVCCLVVFLCAHAADAQQILRGKIFDTESREALPFVNISVLHKTSGTTTGINGDFTLKVEAYDTLLISYVGYESQKLQPTNKKSIEILLKSKSNDLKEVEIIAGEDPANEILRRAINNIDQNNPQNLASFQYTAYHKLFAVTEGSFDTIQSAAEKFFENHYLFLNETYSERIFVRGRHDKETIIGNRMSGVKDPFFAVLGNQFQSFSFYQPHINLFDQPFVNPIATGTFKRYHFTLEDTRINEEDTSYVISFRPLPGKTFNALKGVLTINSNLYAIENVKAQPADEAALVVLKVQQKYSCIDGHWFPQELNSEFILTEQKVSEHPIKYVHVTYISEPHINSVISPSIDRNILNIEFASDANKKDEQFWNSVRVDSLTRREQNTYSLYDSMPLRTLAALNTFVKVAEAIATAKIKVGKFYIPTETLVRNNGYEGLRLGIGFQTGEAISKIFVAESYLAFGVKDEAFKYGGALQINFSRPRDIFAKISYSNDVLEPGNSNYLKPPPAIAASQLARNWLTAKMDSITRIKLQINFRPIRFSESSLFIQRTVHQPAYPYAYAKNSETSLSNFTTAEAGFQFKFVAGETYSQIRNTKISTGYAYPYFDFVFSRSLQNILDGDFKYAKVELKADHQFQWRGSWKTTIQISAGFMKGNAPYFSLFNGKGSNSGAFDLNSFVVPNHFQTMKIYEFTSDRYSYLFMTHHFGRIVSTRSKYFRPELSLKQNVGYGDLSNRQTHSLPLTTMKNGFYESGFMLTNLLRFNYVNLGYIGIGGGVFCRYGSYALADSSRNVVTKISVSFAL
jgi:hypothetical protein